MSREISLDEIKRALEWTTPGKWEWAGADTLTPQTKLIGLQPENDDPETQIILIVEEENQPLIQDADWITHSRTYAEWLIHRVEQLQAENAALAAQIVGHAA